MLGWVKNKKDMLNDEIQFIKEFVELDFNVRKSKWEEIDDEIFESLLKRLNNYYYGDIISDIYRDKQIPMKTFIEDNKYLNSLQQKKIFQILQLNDSSLNKIFCAYLSSEFSGADSYFSKVYFKTVEKKYKIISEYIICFDCEGKGLIKKKKCPECNGRGWIFHGGIEININYTVVQQVKILKPVNSLHLIDYESD